MNLPSLLRARTPSPLSSQAEVARAGRRARRRHPRPQLPAARDPGRRRLRRRLARALAAGCDDRRGGDRLLRRALHGRDGLDPVVPTRRVLIPDLDAGCSLADSITADQLRAWKAQHPGAVVVMYVNTTAEVKAETDYCVTSSNAVAVVEHIYREHGPTPRSSSAPTCSSAPTSRSATGQHDARVGRRVPRPRRHPPARHRRACAPRTRAPTS